MSRIFVVGASGTIGKLVVAALKEVDPSVQIVTGGRTGSDIEIDLDSGSSIEAAFTLLAENPVDHVVVAGGNVIFKGVSGITRSELVKGFDSKGLGQIHAVSASLRALKDGGSITLTSGVLSDQYVPGGAFASAVNSAVNAFAKSASNELPRGIRVNVVSPGLLAESAGVYGPYFRGSKPVEGKDVALGYVRSIFGGITGKIIQVNNGSAFVEF